MPVNSFRRSTLVHIVIDPGLPVAVERQPGIIQRRYQVTADIPDIADVVVHCFKDILNVAAVEFQTCGMSSPFTRIVGFAEHTVSTIMSINSRMVSFFSGFC